MQLLDLSCSRCPSYREGGKGRGRRGKRELKGGRRGRERGGGWGKGELRGRKWDGEGGRRMKEGREERNGWNE